VSFEREYWLDYLLQVVVIIDWININVHIDVHVVSFHSEDICAFIKGQPLRCDGLQIRKAHDNGEPDTRQMKNEVKME
jgi:hypothetical protein